MSLNAATVATYRYDAINRLTKILDAASLATNYSYDATSKLTSRKLPNGVLTSYQYDGLDRLTRLLDTKGVATVADHQYQYNTASQITQIAEPTNTRSYGYDAADRLTSSSYTNPLQGNENYSYDGVGNRTSSHLSASYGYQPFNRLTSTTTASYSYNANGNLTLKTGSNGTTQYMWDFENRLKQVTLPNGNTVAYKYDAFGHRIKRTPSGGVSTNFVYDGQDVIKDLNSDGSTVDYLNGPGIDNKLRLTDSRLIATGPLYFLQDQLGSTTTLMNSLGVAVAQVSYDGFGNSSGSSLTRYDYTGRERDPDTAMLYYRARWYDPQVGRFISEDPVGFAGGPNWYAYVSNNPGNSTDRTGLWETPAHNYIIDQALENCLSEAQRQQLKDASRWVDRADNQFAVTAYQHGMRAPGQSINDARNAANKFISNHEGAARSAFPNGCRDGYGKIPWNALWEFGKALHTLTDMTSPSHEGFQIWHDPPPPPLTGVWAIYAANHHRKETLSKLKSDPTRLQMIKKMVRDEFAKTFGDCGCCGD